MKRSTLFLLILLSILLALSATMLAYYLSVLRHDPKDVLEVQRVPIEFTVESERVLGFTINDTALALGGIPAGGVARKTFNVTHRYAQPVFLTLHIKGDFADFATVSPPRAALRPGEILEGVLDVRPTNTTRLGPHNGTLIIVFYSIKR